MKIQIRHATMGDLTLILTLFEETIKFLCVNDYNQKQIEAWIRYGKNDQKKWFHRIQKQFFLIAEIDNKLVGFSSLENDCFIDLLYVHHNHLNQGVASQLYSAMVNESIRLGSIKLVSNVSITAKPFFEKQGFKVIKTNKNMINGIELINYKMMLTMQNSGIKNLSND